jgi:serine/threonine protein kinase
MPLEPGYGLGPYEILGLAGAGGMGEVYRARDNRLRRTVAIKVASSVTSADPHLRARFQHEARAIAALNHPHICAIHDVATFDDRDVIVMEYAASRNPRTRFIVYSRSVFQTHGGEEKWVATQVARLPVLRDRLNAFIVPGGQEKASFREPGTAQLLRARITQVLGLAPE